MIALMDDMRRTLFKVKLLCSEPASLSRPIKPGPGARRSRRLEASGSKGAARRLAGLPVYRLRGSTPRPTADVLLLGSSPWSRVRGRCSETEFDFGR